MSKRVLIATGVFPPEPVTSASMDYDLALSLFNGGCDVTVIRQKPSRPAGKCYEGDNMVFPFKCISLSSFVCPESKLIGRLRESWSHGKACARYILKHRDEIDAVYNDSWALFGYYFISRACVRARIPYIPPIQDIYPESLFTGRALPKCLERFVTFLLLPFDRYTQRNACKIRTISDEMADYLSETRAVPRDRYLVLDNWQNDEDFTYSPIRAEKKNGIVFGYVGSVNSHSNTELIIKAFAKAGIKNAELHIYGGGNHRDSCMKLVDRLNVKNVIFDMVEKKQVPAVQSGSDVLVLALPSGNGGLCLPSKMTSYMLSGRAVLAGVDADCVTARYIHEADSGIVVSPDDVDSMAEGFRRFSMMTLDELNRLGCNSRSFAERKLTKSSNLPRIVDALLTI